MREGFRASRGAFPDQRNDLAAPRRRRGDRELPPGTHLGALGGLAPTGRAFRVQMMAFIRGRRLVCERVYFDSASILRQIAG